MKKFIFDTLVNKENILNQTRLIRELKLRIEGGTHLVLHGMRNTAKTSIIKNIIIPYWQKKHKNSLAIYCDLMAVKDLVDISERLTISFNEAYKKTFVIKSVFKQGIKFLQGLQPTLQLATDGSGMDFRLSSEDGENIISLPNIW